MAVIIKKSSLSQVEINPPIVEDGLVLYYDVNNPRSYVDGSSTTTDLSRANNDGTLVNSPTFNTDPFYFTGFTSNQYVGTNSGWETTIPTGSADRTILAAFRTPSAFTANYYHILHYGSAENTRSYGFAVWTNGGTGNIGSSNADAVLGNHTWNGTFYADYNLQTNTDYVGVIRYRDTDSPRATMYIDGSFRSIGYGQGETSSYSIDTGDDFSPRIGNRISTPSEPLGAGGRIYSIMFYDRFLDDSETVQIYNTVKDSHNI